MSDDGHYFFEFDCPICGKVDTVHFKPKRPDELICSDCLEEHGSGHDFSKILNSPRRKHKTNVALPIICSDCGKEDILDYVPKGVPLYELKCGSCMFEALPESKWAEINQLKDREADKKYSIACEKCGCDWELPFKPRPGKRYRCEACFDENDQSPEGPVMDDSETPEPWENRGGFRVRKKKNID